MSARLLNGLGIIAFVVCAAARNAGRHQRPSDRANDDFLEGYVRAYASALLPYKVVAGCTSLFGLVALVTKQITRLFQKQAAWSTGVYAMIAGVFCWSLLSSIWILVWPLSGAQLLLTGDRKGLHVACNALIFFSPARILNVLLTCVIVLFAPVVLIPPRQPETPATRNLPQWTHRTLVRMYAIMLLAQIWNCWYVFEFLQFNLAAMAALQGKIDGFAKDKIRVASDTFGSGLDLTPSFLRSNAFDDLTPVSAMMLYLVVLWSALMITYERLTRRRFHSDFPFRLMLVLFPCFKRFTVCGGKIAEYYASGQDHVLQFVDRLRIAKAVVEHAPQKLGESIDRVIAAFLEAKRAVMSAAKAAKRETRKNPKETLDVLREFVHKELDARLTAFLHWREADHHYFEQLQNFMLDGVEGVDLDSDDDIDEPGLELSHDEPVLPTQPFAPFVTKLIHSAIDASLDAIAMKLAPDAMIDSVKDALCNEIDYLSSTVVSKMRRALKYVEKLAAKFEAFSMQTGDFADPQNVLGHQADVLVKTVSKLSITRQWYYPYIYSFLFGALTVVAYGFKVLTFSMVFIFWNRWSVHARVMVVVMLLLFGIMIAFNCVFFSEALAGRLGRIQHRHVSLASITQVHRPAVTIGWDPCERDALLGSSARDSSPKPSGAFLATVAGPDEGAGELVHDTLKAWRLVILQPLVAVALIVLGAFALARNSGLSEGACGARWA